MFLKAKKEHFGFFIFFLVLLIASLFACLFTLRYIDQQAIQAEKDHIESIRLAYEISRTSDNATRMLRMYVVTKNPKFKDFYNEILAIRNGTAPRPLKFSQLYWDLVVDPDKRPQAFGKPESLRSRILSHNFTLKELAILNTAQGKIHDLLDMEQKALHAMEGKFEDAKGAFSIKGKPNQKLAEEILFGDEYLRTKAAVLLPIHQFYEHVVNRTHLVEKKYNTLIGRIILLAIFFAALSTGLMLMYLYKVLHALGRANRQNELLLHNIFPESIIARLKRGEHHIVDEFSQASVLFADIIDFTQMTKSLGAKETVHLLNDLYRVLDKLTLEYGVEKIKTIGDNYMVVSGIPEKSTENARQLAYFALAMLEQLKLFNERKGSNLRMRVGMSTGPLIAGVIGHEKFAYDVWGDVVNLASRLEESADPDSILVSEKMAVLLEDEFILEPQEPIEIKGLGLQKSSYLIRVC